MFCWHTLLQDIEYEEDDYGIDDVTAGMAGLGGGILGGARPASPRKRALIVACSYPGTSAPLPGTLNDADDILALLIDEFDVPECPGAGLADLPAFAAAYALLEHRVLSCRLKHSTALHCVLSVPGRFLCAE